MNGFWAFTRIDSYSSHCYFWISCEIGIEGRYAYISTVKIWVLSCTDGKYILAGEECSICLPYRRPSSGRNVSEHPKTILSLQIWGGISVLCHRPSFSSKQPPMWICVQIPTDSRSWASKGLRRRIYENVSLGMLVILHSQICYPLDFLKSC